MIHLTDISKGLASASCTETARFKSGPAKSVGLVGPNGAGKSTIFRIIAGQEGVDEGTISVPEKTVIGFFSQDIGDMRGKSALEEVKSGAGRAPELATELAKMEKQLELSESLSDEQMQKLLERYGEAQAEFEAIGGYDLESRAQEILTGLGIGPDRWNAPTESFSGGWKMRIALAKILALQPDVLLADEPTNHLDLESIVWLEEWLVNFKGSLVMTSHDREFMNRIVSRVVEIANKAIVSYSGNYDFYERERKIRREQLVAAAARQVDMLAKEEEFIARFAARASHAAQVQSRVKKLEKIDRIEVPPEEGSIDFEFAPAARGGDEVVKLENVGKIYLQKRDATSAPEEKLVFRGASALIKRADRIAVVGINGAGKSTLLKIIAGETEPSEGKANLGPSTTVGYFSQSSLDVLDPDKTIFDEIHDRIPTASIGFVRSLLGAFNFSGDDALKKISILSGGEKSRVVLATMLAKPCNLLVLDEPTNHLDIKSREVLLQALLKFEGTLILVSHDRHFLKAVANRVFEVDRHQILTYDGDYPYYLWKKSDSSSAQRA